jgi:hypothetical protein
MNSNIITSFETLTQEERINQIKSLIEAHAEKTHGQTHLGHVITNPGVAYKDSAGQNWPGSNGRVSIVKVNGVLYYVPSQIIP